MTKNRRQIIVPVLETPKCEGCGLCAAVCRKRVLAIIDGHAAVVLPGYCDYCGLCETVCVHGGVNCPYYVSLE